MSDSLKNILIIKPSSLGDIVLALPALTALHKSFPDARISWMIRPEFAPLLENHPHLNEIILFDRKFLAKAWFHPGASGSLLSLIKQLRNAQFDAVIDFQGLFRTASIAWLTGCKKRFGIAGAREFASFFYTHKIKQTKDCIHLVDFYLKIIGAAGATSLDVEFVLPQHPEAADSIKNLLKSHYISPDNYVVFIPGSAHEDKRWPTERFAELAERISLHHKLPVVATGDAGETILVEKLKNLSKVPVVNIAGKTSLSELVVLLKNARLVVSNDTGPGHIAAALSTPLVLMFSWSNPARIAPYKRIECLVAREPFSRGHKIKSRDPKHNVDTITVDEVYQKVCEQLNT
ncbi:MAG: glycosyltransferase family 9 protein [Sedimentisphaerales bacterium]|nr:glycosyltransferase family 9 protein [Sedimentisphaerales bacterium]